MGVGSYPISDKNFAIAKPLTTLPIGVKNINCGFPEEHPKNGFDFSSLLASTLIPRQLNPPKTSHDHYLLIYGRLQKEK